MKLSFSLACTPPRVTKQMKKTTCRKVRGKWIPVPVDTPELKEATQLFMELLLPYRPQTPLDGPLLFTLVWHFDHNMSASEDVKRNLVWMDTAPDLDNMEKLILDTIAKMGFIANDSRIALKLTGKVRDPKWQGIAGSIQKLPNFVEASDCCVNCLAEMNITESAQ